MVDKDNVMMNDGHSIQIDFVGQYREKLTLAGHSYQLVQLHFHSPSENEVSNQFGCNVIHLRFSSGVLTGGKFEMTSNDHSRFCQLVSISSCHCLIHDLLLLVASILLPE